jgi:hypothetical protein
MNTSVRVMARFAEDRGTVLHASLPPRSTAEQIMAMPAEIGRRWTAREVRQLIEDSPLAPPRYELVDGELLVTPSPAYPHNRRSSV